MELIKKYKQRKAIKAWNNSVLGQALTSHSREYFYEGKTILTGFSDAKKQEIIRDFYEKVFALTQVENPFLTTREYVASYVWGYTSFQVLCLTEEEKQQVFYSDCPYISGTLYRHIEELSEHNEDLKKLKWKSTGLSADELVSFCNARAALHLYYVNGMNMVRRECNDFDAEKDWLRPFIQSMLIWDEDTYRRKIALPTLLPDELDALRHSTFMNMVTNGCENPYYEWEMAYKNKVA